MYQMMIESSWSDLFLLTIVKVDWSIFLWKILLFKYLILALGLPRALGSLGVVPESSVCDEASFAEHSFLLFSEMESAWFRVFSFFYREKKLKIRKKTE